MNNNAVHNPRLVEEYHRFGPWAYPVRDAGEMPPRFDPWYAELKDSVFLIKQPFSMERRMARVGGDLYERILAVTEKSVVSLHLQGGSVHRRDIPFWEIAAIRLVQDLLYGWFSLDLVNGGSLDVEFSTVSETVYGDLAEAVRKGLHSVVQGRPFAPVGLPDSVLEGEHLLRSRFEALRDKNPGMRLVHLQPSRILKPVWKKPISLSGFFSRFVPWRLDGSFMALSEHDIALFRTGTGIPVHRGSPGYQHELLILPSSAYHSVHVEPRTAVNGAALFALLVNQGRRCYELLLEREPSGLKQMLR